LAIFFVLISGCTGKNAKTANAEYDFTTIEKGSIDKTVSSSGTLEPVSTVNIVSQMSGIVEKVNVDYNDHVTKGQTLLEINTDMLKLQQQQQKAAVAKAKANYDLQLINYTNQQKLADKGLISDYELKTGKTTLDVNAAELSSAEAALKVVETEISQYAFIKSPITGIVLTKSVEVGQSVVEGSSSNSSTLFTIAENLTQMQIEATVDEIDIASILKGQTVQFTVEALVGKTFSGTVQTIHLEPTTTDNVVSYTVIIAVDNADGTLLPGMTAEANFIVSSQEDVLLVPNSALRYEPTTLTSEEIATKIQEASIAKDTKTTSKAAETSSDTTATADDTTKNIWYLDDSGKLAVLAVKTGVSDGSNTVIVSDQDLEGKKIIVKEKVI
jgi:HlyD family secretion protein